MRRDLNIDLIKILAMFGVIGLHTLGGGNTSFSTTLYETCVFAVPLFFMCSGYILINRDTLTINYSVFKSLRIIRFLLIISLFVWVLSSIFRWDLDFNKLLEYTLGPIEQKGPLWDCWFLVAMIFTYLLSPLFHFISNKNMHMFLGVCAVLFVIEDIIFIENLIYDYPFEMSILQSFRIWNWLFYFCIGGALYHIRTCCKPSIKVLMPIFACMLFANVLFQNHLRSIVNSPLCEYFYSSVVTIVFCLILFYSILTIKINDSFVIKELSKLFLPVYIYHPFVIETLNHFNCFDNIPLFKPLFLFLLVSIITIIFSFMFMRIPHITKIFKI